jgi:hypothetical protein
VRFAIRWLLLLGLVGQPSGSFDVSSLTIGAPTVVAALDLGTLKGEPRRVSWSADGANLALRTSEGDKPTDRVYFFTVAAAGGPVVAVEREPDWATEYWAFKSDRSAPGLAGVLIDVQQTHENVKIGTGSAGAAAGIDRAGGNTVMSADNVEREAQRQKQNVIRLTLYGEPISQFVNQRPEPGEQFSWGPTGTGAVAYVDPDGRLFVLDQKKHKRSIAAVKDALLPAWSADGTKLAYIQKSGRKKYTLAWVPIARDKP